MRMHPIEICRTLPMKPIKNRLCFLYTKHLVVCALLTMVVATTPLTHAGTGGQSPEADKPNILLILADDLGWNDVGYHGSAIETPVIDRLANEGIELDRFYAQPTCSPARAGLMTGKSPSRVGITGPLGSQFDYGLPAEEKILPQYLNEAGYRSVLIGKWHLGHGRSAYLPNNRGFSHFYGYLNGDIGYWDHLSSGRLDWQRNGKSVREEGYATQLLADEAIRIVDSHDPSTPLFLYLSMPAPHLPNEAPADTIAKYSQLSPEKRQIHAAMVTELDSAIGRVLEAFDAKGILNNTIVVFASDNGGAVEGIAPQPLRWGVDLATAVFDRPIPIGPLEVLATIVNDGGSDNTPLPSGKGNVAEGGVRVPAVVWWPQHLQAGRYAGFHYRLRSAANLAGSSRSTADRPERH